MQQQTFDIFPNPDIQLWQGNCLEQHEHIKSGSVDLILTDLPFGIVKSLGTSKVAQSKSYKVPYWDDKLPIKSIYKISDRILRENGKLILFAQQPFTTELIHNQLPNLSYNYNMYWDKMHFANCLGANKAPVSYIEDILVFSKNYDCEGLHPLRPYFKKVLDFIGLNKKVIVEKIGQSADHCFRVESSQFSLCTEKTYNELIQVFGIDKMEEFRTFADISTESDGLNSTFNLWEGNKYKSNILKYKKDYNGYHPTQKPVLLLEDLIQTFSNEGDLVVDLTMGSASTGVACRNTNRDFIGIEKDPEYFRIAQERIKQATRQQKLFPVSGES